MNTLAKVLIGVGVVAAVATTSYVVVKKTKEKKEKDIAEQAVENDHKDDTIIERIKTAAYKKTVKILAWVLVNKDRIEAVAAILGIIGALFNVINAVRDFGFGKKWRKDLDFMVNHDHEFEDVWNTHMQNQAGRYDDLMQRLNDIQDILAAVPKKKGA